MQHALHRKTKQEQKRQELRQQEVLHDIKDIFVEAFDIVDVNVDQTIGEQLMVHIFEKINTEDMETNKKLMN